MMVILEEEGGGAGLGMGYVLGGVVTFDVTVGGATCEFVCERESCKVKIDQHEPQETKVNHNRPKSTATSQGEPQETRVPLVVTMNHSVLFDSLWCFGSGWCFGTLWSLVASLAGVLVHLVTGGINGQIVHNTLWSLWYAIGIVLVQVGYW